jgi:hypothetical protein
MVLMHEASVEALTERRALAAKFEQQLEVVATKCGLTYFDLSLRQLE